MKTNKRNSATVPPIPHSAFRPPHSEWEIGALTLYPAVVWQHAVSSLKLRFSSSVLTVLTITTSTAFMMYLLTMAKTDADAGDDGSWLLMMILALIVSAAGVLNTMLMNVTRRYREIGTMKCLGALDSFVLLSVLVEAAILGFAGAVAGVMSGLLISVLLAMADYGTACLTHMALNLLAAKLLGVLAIGMVLTTFGAAAPAAIAAKMPPMEAMRGEK